MRTTVIALTSLLLILSPISASAAVLGVAQNRDDALAALFYPDDLKVDARGSSNLTEIRRWKTLRVDLDATGVANYLIVAYSNGFTGRVRVIKDAASGPVLIADPRAPLMFQSSPTIATYDLEADSRPEVVVTFAKGRKGRLFAWVFRWDGQALQCVNPPFSSDDPEPAERREMRDPTFVDLDGDGHLEVLEPSETFGVDIEFETELQSRPLIPDRSYVVFTLGRDGFRQNRASPPVTFFGYFERATARPNVTTTQFRAVAGNYVLRVLSGDSREHMVESAELRVNGRVVLSPNDFRANFTTIEKRIILEEGNTLTVDLRGEPASRIHVIIQPAEN